MSRWLNVGYTWLSSELLTRLGFLLALVFVANLLRQRRSPSSTIAWLLVILLEPYLGVPLYVIFGGRKMNPLAQKRIEFTADPPTSGRVPAEWVQNVCWPRTAYRRPEMGIASSL